MRLSKVFAPSLGWSKVWYFETFATSAILYPLLNIFLRRSGLSEAEIGVIAALRPWTSAVAGNLWAGLGDQTGAHKKILMFTYVSTVAIRYSIGLAHSFLLVAALVISTEAMSAPILILADASSIAAGKSEGDYGKARMWGAVGWGMFSPLAGLLVTHYGGHASFDASLLGGLLGVLPTALLPTQALKAKSTVRHEGSQGPEPQPECTGRVRHKEGHLENIAEPDRPVFPCCHDETLLTDLIASSSDSPPASHHGELSPPGLKRGDSLLEELAEFLPIVPSPEMIDYDSNLITLSGPSPTYGAPGATTLSASPQTPRSPSTPSREGLHSSKHADEMPIGQKLAQIFSKGEVVVFFAMTVLYGFAAGCIDGYLFLFLDQLGAPEVLMGLTITVACIVELPVFHFMGKILKFVGIEQMLHWVVFFFLVRLGCYTCLGHLPSPWMVLPVETLNGITFGCAWAAGTVKCSRIAPLGLEATTQAIFSGLYMGFGLGLGGLFGGIVYNTLGATATFAGAFSVVLVGWMICIAARQFLQCKSRLLRRPVDSQEPLISTYVA